MLSPEKKLESEKNWESSGFRAYFQSHIFGSMNCSRGIQLCGNFLAQVFVQILDVHLEIFSSMRSFHFLPPANEFMFGELAASMKGARFIWCIICIQHKSTSGEAVLEDFCWRPVLTCVHISNMLRQLASGYRSWDVVRTEHFFEVILSYFIQHTHTEWWGFVLPLLLGT